MNQAPILIVSGAPGAGKTTVARRLAARFAASLHIPVDELREWVVSGLEHPLPERTPEAERQLALARQTAAEMAERYARAGFAVVVDDLLFANEAEAFFGGLATEIPLRRVLLVPAWEAVLARNIERGGDRFDAGRWAAPLRALHEQLADQPLEGTDWIVIDSGGLDAEATADAILARTGLSG